MILSARLRWWDGTLWWRTCREGGFDGWRTIRSRRLPCDAMAAALTRPRLHGEIRRLSKPER